MITWLCRKSGILDTPVGFFPLMKLTYVDPIDVFYELIVDIGIEDVYLWAVPSEGKSCLLDSTDRKYSATSTMSSK